MTDAQMFKAALLVACRELYYTQKYGHPMPEILTTLTATEAREVEKLYERFIDEAIATIRDTVEATH